jgi:hypothetical protein
MLSQSLNITDEKVFKATFERLMELITSGKPFNVEVLESPKQDVASSKRSSASKSNNTSAKKSH